MHKYWANFPSDLDNFSLSASIMYQNWWIKLKANPNNKNKRSKWKRKKIYNQITILKFSFHLLIGNSTYFPRHALKKESKYNIAVIVVTLERHYEEIAIFKQKVWCICNSRSKQIVKLLHKNFLQLIFLYLFCNISRKDTNTALG